MPRRSLDPGKAKMLAYLPGGREGFAAVARSGKGEVVAIGLPILPRRIDEQGRGTDNARFLRNLLTARVGR